MIAGRYELGREIGRGGSGSVHLGRDSVLSRDVAIKRIGLMPGAQSPDLARAEREARLAAALDHPNVVTVLDLVEENDAHWLVMEYVDGRALSHLIREDGPLGPQRAGTILGQVADALRQAHAAEIIHRDIKPSNILVTADDVAKLTDFGIARSTSDPSLTQTGLVTGSPAYLAPEVASGATATAASDVWSMGATLYHVLTGTPPYDVGDNLVGALYRIVHDDPPRLDPAHPLAGLVAATMVKDPGSRISAEQVRDELWRAARGVPATIRPAPPSRTASPPVVESRSSRVWWIAALVGLALIAGVTYLLRPGDGARPEESAANPPATQEPVTQEPTEASMDAFIEQYLAAVTTDPEAAFAMLTPDFQRASGGMQGYLGWWGTVRSASLREIESDPEDLTVEYTVRYVMKSGSRSTQRVQLQLQHDGEAYLISGEDD